jgi:hypothetical protein
MRCSFHSITIRSEQIRDIALLLLLSEVGLEQLQSFRAAMLSFTLKVVVRHAPIHASHKISEIERLRTSFILNFCVLWDGLIYPSKELMPFNASSGHNEVLNVSASK